jgi:hypothetical protein
VPLLSSYDTLLASLIALAKSSLTLVADGPKLELKLFSGLQQLIVLYLKLLGLLLVLVSVLDEGQ